MWDRSDARKGVVDSRLRPGESLMKWTTLFINEELRRSATDEQREVLVPSLAEA